MNDSVLVALTRAVQSLRERLTALSKEVGPAGVDGKDGRDGVDGKDGRDGVDGKDGRDGLPGRDGSRGPVGKAGSDGSVGPMPKHEWSGTKLRFQLSGKKWGKWVDLQGPRGSAGGGFSVSGGGFDPAEIGPSNNLLAGDEIVVYRQGNLVRVPVTLSDIPTRAVTVGGVPVTVDGKYVVVGE